MATILNGTVGFASGRDGIVVAFATPMPSANYAVNVQATNTAGYGGPAPTYFNVLHKTPAGFDLQHKRCADGVPVVLATGVTIDYLAVHA